MERLLEQTNLSEHVGFRLLQNTCTFNETYAQNSVIYVWAENGVQRQLTERNVCEMTAPMVRNWLNTVNEACAPIIENGDVQYLLSGEGCEIQAIKDVLDGLNAPWNIYVPQTIGARDCSLTVCLGMFYSWKEQQKIRADERVSCAQQDVVASVGSVSRRMKSNDDEGGFTKKLKSILLNDK